MSSLLLRNFEIRWYYQNEPKFNGVYSTKNLPKIKYGTYAMSLEEFKSIACHWKALCIEGFGSFRV